MSDDRVAKQLYDWLAEGVELRFGTAGDKDGPIALPAYETGPSEFTRVLLRARKRADRIEELLSKAKRVQRKLAAVQKDAADIAQDKLDEALVAGNASRIEFSTGMERKAEASLKSFDEKRAERLAQRRLDVANEVVEALKDLHFGLAGWRTDVRDVIRSYQLESNLEH